MICLHHVDLFSGTLHGRLSIRNTFGCFVRVKFIIANMKYEVVWHISERELHIIFHASCFCSRTMFCMNLAAWVVTFFDISYLLKCIIMYLLMCWLISRYQQTSRQQDNFFFSCFCCYSDYFGNSFSETDVIWLSSKAVPFRMGIVCRYL